MSYTLVLEWMPGDLYMSAVTARCTAPTSSYSVVWLPPNKVYQITLYCGSTSLVSFLVGAFRGKAWSYMSTKSTNPSTYFGGTWVAWGSGRVPVGINTSDSNFNTVEKTGGASTVALTTAQMPSHSHAKGSLATASAGAHTHNLQNQKAPWGLDGGGNRCLVDATSGYTAVTNKTTTSGGAHTHTISGSTAAAGSGSAHNNLQPYIVCYMWKRTA